MESGRCETVTFSFFSFLVLQVFSRALHRCPSAVSLRLRVLTSRKATTIPCQSVKDYQSLADWHPSCMVCMVRNEANDQMIPSCATYPTEGMRIDTESDEVITLRRMSIELLLSDHRARCGVCEGKEKCRLRELSLQMKAKWTRYGPLAPVGEKMQIHVNGQLYFEPAKCIRCGLCVYNTQDGFTFKGRGFNMQVVIPEQSKSHVKESLAELCPTGALFLKNEEV